MLVSLKDKIAIVVGASSGIGRATALGLAREGAKVMACARRRDRLQSLREEAKGYAAEIFVADASRPEDMQRMAAATRERFGDANILVYNTGINTLDRAMSRLSPPV